jgi:pSer/pThr/pTyr-binding forkhead associated (FHA) protein
MANFLHQTLQRLEKRLQSLIEGSTARLFPAYNFHNELGQQLVKAMQMEICATSDGSLIAPNLFTIFLPEEQAQIFQNQTELLDELADCLLQACEDTPVHFSSPPVVKVFSNPKPDPTEIQILAQFSLPQDEETSTLEPLPAISSGEQPPPAFLIVDGTRVFPLSGKTVRIGQSEENDLIIDHPLVSPMHAQLRLVNGQYMIFDLNSAGGTFVNGTRVIQCLLSAGDVISLGGLPLVFGIDHSLNLDNTQELAPLS